MTIAKTKGTWSSPSSWLASYWGILELSFLILCFKTLHHWTWSLCLFCESLWHNLLISVSCRAGWCSVPAKKGTQSTILQKHQYGRSINKESMIIYSIARPTTELVFNACYILFSTLLTICFVSKSHLQLIQMGHIHQGYLEIQH